MQTLNGIFQTAEISALKKTGFVLADCRSKSRSNIIILKI